jgi:hypothetical protein
MFDLIWKHRTTDPNYEIAVKFVKNKPNSLKNEKEELLKQGFIEFVSTPLGKILLITIDQLCHLTFLFPIIYFAMN